MKNSYDLQSFPNSEVPWRAKCKSRCLLLALFLGSLWGGASFMYAGGGGENLLLIVNPTDEPSLRIANAYVAARAIPINNILYIDPTGGAGAPINGTVASFATLYQTTVPDAIAARGLTNQIDYIGTLGQPHCLTSNYVVCLDDVLNHLTQIQNGMSIDSIPNRRSELLQDTVLTLGKFTYTSGSNGAIHHSQKLTPIGVSGTATYVQWYMSGMVGNTQASALTPTQAIENLQRTVKGDGTNPQGTIYFEDSNEVRTSTRSPYWPDAQAYFDKLGLPWIQETTVIFPKNRPSVRGAVVGTGNLNNSTQLVNGSNYLPGSWADNLTSYGGLYGGPGQTKVSGFLLGGAGGTAGTVNEPYAVQSRFTTPAIFLFSNDGSTLGEAFYKSVYSPDLLMFEGDLLSQAYADVPVVAFTAGPANGATVSGVVSLSGSAHLNSHRIATGIAQLQLFVDGLASGSIVTGAVGSFNLNTTALTDGIHEVRIVAYNNSQAASEGYALENLVVKNNGQSVSITGTSYYNAVWNQTLSIPVTSTQGTGLAISSIQLQSIGRLVGSVSASTGSISLDVTKLAYGGNSITPIALLSSGTQQVQGAPITVNRQFQLFPGTVPTPLAKQNPGCDIYFFGGGAKSTLAATNFNAMPSHTLHSINVGLTPSNTYTISARNMPDVYRGTNTAYQLAIMIKTKFTVATAGEYSFYPGFNSYSSAGFFIDGTLTATHEGWNGTTWATNKGQQAIFLLAGEHTITVQLAQTRTGRSDSDCNFSFLLRGPDGNTVYAGAPTFYTTSKRVGP